MNVYPRKPLEALRDHYEQQIGYRLTGLPGLPLFFTDVEFPANFYPAEQLDALLAACEAVVRAIPDNTSNADARHRLAAAFRAFREQVTA